MDLLKHRFGAALTPIVCKLAKADVNERSRDSRCAQEKGRRYICVCVCACVSFNGLDKKVKDQHFSVKKKWNQITYSGARRETLR